MFIPDDERALNVAAAVVTYDIMSTLLAIHMSHTLVVQSWSSGLKETRQLTDSGRRTAKVCKRKVKMENIKKCGISLFERQFT